MNVNAASKLNKNETFSLSFLKGRFTCFPEVHLYNPQVKLTYYLIIQLI